MHSGNLEFDSLIPREDDDAFSQQSSLVYTQPLEQGDEDEEFLRMLQIQPSKKRDETGFGLEALKSKIRGHRAASYFVDFTKRANTEGVTVCNVDKSELEEKKKLLAEEQRDQAEDSERRHARYLAALNEANVSSIKRIRLWHKATERYKDHFERVKRVRHRQYKRHLGRTFKAATRHFKGVIKQRKKGLRKTYGRLQEFRLRQSHIIKNALLWRYVPQKIKLYIKYIRGVKDKLPKGKYILRVSLRDRIGGRIVKIDNKKKIVGEKTANWCLFLFVLVCCWPYRAFKELLFWFKTIFIQNNRQDFFQQTMEIDHDGKFNSLELEFEQPLFLVSPSQSQRKPYMVFTFELIQTEGPNPGMCCAWGAFPVEDSSFDVITGKFKVPLIRGWLTPNIDQFWKYHQTYAQKLGMWMGNLYFQVKPLPRERFGRMEQPGHVYALKKLSDVVVEQDELFLSESDTSSDEESTDDTDIDLVTSEEDYSDGEAEEKQSDADSLFPDEKSPGTPGSDESNDDEASEESASEKSQEESDEETDLTEDLAPVNEPGILMKQRDEADLASYRYSIPQPTGFKESVLTFRKGKYLTKAVLTDMGMSDVKSREFWVSVALFVLCFFARQYLHYFSQWVLLNIPGMTVPNLSYTPSIFWVELGYQRFYLGMWKEALVVLIGMVGVIFFQIFFVFAIFILQKFRINVPAFASKMCVMFGVATFLDPLLVLISDLMGQLFGVNRFDSGDWFKLYNYFEAAQSGEGYWGIMITMMMYTYCCMATGWILYQFLLKIFMNGQIIDVYRRVHAPEQAFFLPLDLEVGREEMEWAASKAKRFRGATGSIRRIVIMEYSLTDPRDPLFFERSLHFIIYTLMPRGGGGFARKVYRQFLQLENNAIVELFKDTDAKILLSNQMRSINSLQVMNNAENFGVIDEEGSESETGEGSESDDNSQEDVTLDGSEGEYDGEGSESDDSLFDDVMV